MTVDEADRWLEANPDLWLMFCNIADGAYEEGRRRWSADGIAHIIRWSTKRDINNDLTAYLARAYLLQRPDRPRFFELRISGADEMLPSGQFELF